VAKNSAVTRASDLVGKVVAVNALKSITSIAVDAWLDANGVKPDSVKFLELPFTRTSIALTSGRIDAAFISEPSSAWRCKTARDHRPSLRCDLARLPDQCLVHDSGLRQSPSDIVRKFAAIMAEAGAWANTTRPNRRPFAKIHEG